MTAIVWLRRSMRIHDNTALVRASQDHDTVIPLYCIDTELFEDRVLGYPRVKFWHDSLTELQDRFEEDGKRLITRHGAPLEELQNVIAETGAEAVYHNRDYGPWARERDENVAEELDVPVNTFKDIVLVEQDEILTNSGTPYKVYTYFKKKWFARDHDRPQAPEDFSVPDVACDPVPSLSELGYGPDDHVGRGADELDLTCGEMDIWDGGRENGLAWLDGFMDKIGDYADKRDAAALDATSKLSPHLKFGTISPREAFWTAERARARGAAENGVETWQEELAWREFYFQVLYHWPETTEKAFLEQYRGIEWASGETADGHWQAFIEGKTGFPFVDAGMRQLKATGWMHNRLRMVVTSFCAKDIHIDWRRLHAYFKTMFVDAEIAAMVGGIQWAYSIGTDAQPYFRVFNPWTQGEKYDPDGDYIRRWVPELEDVPDEYIHRPFDMPDDVQEESDCLIGQDYPAPIVNHGEERKHAIDIFEDARDE